MFSRRSLVVVLAMMVAAPARAHGPQGMSGGKLGDPAKATRTVEVVATENAFSIKSLEVRDGETIRFILRNDGMDPHEFLIGTKAEHAEHAENDAGHDGGAKETGRRPFSFRTDDGPRQRRDGRSGKDRHFRLDLRAHRRPRVRL